MSQFSDDTPADDGNVDETDRNEPTHRSGNPAADDGVSGVGDADASRRFDPDEPLTLAAIGVCAVLGVASAGISGWYLWNADDSEQFRASTQSWQLLVVWIVLVMAIAAYTAAISFPSWFTFRTVRTIRQLGPVRALCAAVLVFGPLVLFGNYVPVTLGVEEPPHTGYLLVLNLGGGLGAAAAVVALLNITLRTSRSVLDREALVASRTISRRALNILGGVWALAVLAARARQGAIGSLPAGQSFPDGLMLAYGGVLAVAIAAIYLPAEHNLDLQARRIVRELALSDDGRARAELGLDQAPTDRLMRSLTLLSPLVAAIASLAVE